MQQPQETLNLQVQFVMLSAQIDPEHRRRDSALIAKCQVESSDYLYYAVAAYMALRYEQAHKQSR